MGWLVRLFERLFDLLDRSFDLNEPLRGEPQPEAPAYHHDAIVMPDSPEKCRTLKEKLEAVDAEIARIAAEPEPPRYRIDYASYFEPSVLDEFRKAGLGQTVDYMLKGEVENVSSGFLNQALLLSMLIRLKRLEDAQHVT